LTFLISSAYDASNTDSIVFASSQCSKDAVPPSHSSSLTFPRALVFSAGRGCFSGANTLVVTALSVRNAQSACAVVQASRSSLAHQLNCHLIFHTGGHKSTAFKLPGDCAKPAFLNNTAAFDHVAAAAAATASHHAGISTTPSASTNRTHTASVTASTPSAVMPPDIVMSPARPLFLSPNDPVLPPPLPIEQLRTRERATQRLGAKKKIHKWPLLPQHFTDRHQKLLLEFVQACRKLHVQMQAPSFEADFKKSTSSHGRPPLALSVYSDTQNVHKSFWFHFEDFNFGMYFGDSSQAVRACAHAVSGRSLSQDANGGISVITCSKLSVDAKDTCMESFPHIVALANFWKIDPARTFFGAIKSNSAGRKVAFASVSSRRNSLPTRQPSVDDFELGQNPSPLRKHSSQRSFQGHMRSQSEPTALIMPSVDEVSSTSNCFQLQVGQFFVKLRSPDIASEVVITSNSFLYISSEQSSKLLVSKASPFPAPATRSSPALSPIFGDLCRDAFTSSLIEFRDLSVKYVISANAGVSDAPAQEIHVKRVHMHKRQAIARPFSWMSLCSVECITFDLKSYLFDGGRLVMYMKHWTPPPLPVVPQPNIVPSVDEIIKPDWFVNPNVLLSCIDVTVDTVTLLLRITPDVSSPVMPIQMNHCHASLAENQIKERFMSLSLPSQRVSLSDGGKSKSDAAPSSSSSRPQFSRGALQRHADSSSVGNPFDVNFPSLDLHVAVSPVVSNERIVQVRCCAGSIVNVINSDMFNHILQLFRVMSNEMFSLIEAVSKQTRVRSVFKKYDKSDVGSVLELALPEMLSELGYTVSPQIKLQFSGSSARITFLEFLAITQVFASNVATDQKFELRHKESDHASGLFRVEKKKEIFNRLNAIMFIKPTHLTAVTNPDGGHGALAIFDSGRMFAHVTTAPGSSLSWCFRFTNLNVQFNRLVNWQPSSGQFSLRNLFFFQTDLELRNQVMPIAFKGNSSAAADFSHTKVFLQPACQNCISDVVSHFSVAFSAFSANLNRDVSENSQKLRSNMSAAAKSMMEYAKSSAAELESTVSLAAVVIKFQDVLVLASYDEAGGQVFGSFNFGCMENSRDIITNRSCLPDSAVSLTFQRITFIMLARGEPVETRKIKKITRQSLQFQGRVESAYLHLFVNQDRTKSFGTQDQDSFVGLKLDGWALKVLWKFSDADRPSSLDAIYSIRGPALRLFPQTIASVSLCVDRWTSASSHPVTSGIHPTISTSTDSLGSVAVDATASPPSAVHINISVKIETGQAVLIRYRKSDSDRSVSLDSISVGSKGRHNSSIESSIDEVSKFPLPGIAVKVAFVIKRNTPPLRSGTAPLKHPSKGHTRKLSRELFSVDASMTDKGSLGHARTDSNASVGSGASFDDAPPIAGRHRHRTSSASEGSFPSIDIQNERINILNITFSAGTIQLSPKILEFLLELKAVMPAKPQTRQVQRRNSTVSMSKNALTVLASDGRVAAAKNAIADQWFVVHIVLEESKLELRGEGKLSEQVVLLKVSNSSILYNAGQSTDSSSSIHFVSLSLDKVQLNYTGKAEVYGLSDSKSIISAESLFLHNTTTLDESGDQSVGYCNCKKLVILADLVSPDVVAKATCFMQQWAMSQAEPSPSGSASSSPNIRRDAVAGRGSSIMSGSEVGSPLSSSTANAPLNISERCFFYHFVVTEFDIDCDLGREQHQFFVIKIAPLGLSVSNPLNHPQEVDTSGICYTLGWNTAKLELSCKIKTEIVSGSSYIHLKQPILPIGEHDGAVEELGSASTSVALTGLVTSVWELDNVYNRDNWDLEEICFFDVGTLVANFLDSSEDHRALVDIFYSDLFICMSSSSIVSLRKCMDQLLLVVNQRMTWQADDPAAPVSGKRRLTVTLSDDDKGLPPRRKPPADSSAFSDRSSKSQVDVKPLAPSVAPHVEVGCLYITGENTRVHIFGSSIMDAGIGWHASIAIEYLEVVLESSDESGEIEHEFSLETHDTCLSMNQGFSFDAGSRAVTVKKPCPILRFKDVTKLVLNGKPIRSKLFGPESIMCEFRSDFSKPLWVTSELHLFKNLKTLMRAYSSDQGESVASRRGTAPKSKVLCHG
jgi:hypothetical protein